MRGPMLGWGLVASIVAIGPATAEPTAETIARNCFVCHAPQQVGQRGIPHIGGYPPDAMVRELTLFKTDQRDGTIMSRIAKGLSEAQIQALAVYFSNRPW